MSVVTEAYFRVFEPLLAWGEDTRRATTRALRAARIGTFPEWYLSLSYLSALAAGSGVALATGLALALVPVLPLLWSVLLALALGVAGFLVVRLGFLLYPRMVAAGRGSRIDAEYPSVVMLCYALARGGMGVTEIFRAVAEERDTYGEISREFALVLRDVEWFGMDVNTALGEVAETTPSKTLSGFLGGLVTIMNSGADPRDYFRRQAETQLDQAEARMEQELDLAGMLAEVYVSGLLVLPLLLIVIISVLSVLGSGSTAFVPAIIFGLIPLGTLGYLVLLETLLPPPDLATPTPPREGVHDFGVDTLDAAHLALPQPDPHTYEIAEEDARRAMKAEGMDEPDGFRLAVRARLLWLRRNLRAGWQRFLDRATTKPADALDASGLAALAVLIGGGVWLWRGGAAGHDLLVGGTTVGFLAILAAIVPIGLFHEIRARRAGGVDGALPEMLSRLTGFNERGISLLRAFRILGTTGRGPLADELNTVNRDVSWTANLRGALRRMRSRARTRKLMKVSVLFERASAATGNLKDVLEIATQEATRTESISARKKASMMSYVVVIYVVFAVFLYVVYMVANLFYGPDGFAGGTEGAQGMGSGGFAPETARLLFLHAVLIQGVASGLVAGKIGEGHVMSGIKHAAILGLLAWTVFTLGVMG